MKKLFNQDNFILGVVIGIIAPWILFGILYLLNILFGEIIFKVPSPPLLKTSTLQLIAIVVNVFVMRQYLVKLKFDKTGRGLLIVTFVYILVYFIFDYLIKKG
jgi:hypothetical protein